MATYTPVMNTPSAPNTQGPADQRVDVVQAVPRIAMPIATGTSPKTERRQVLEHQQHRPVLVTVTAEPGDRQEHRGREDRGDQRPRGHQPLQLQPLDPVRPPEPHTTAAAAARMQHAAAAAGPRRGSGRSGPSEPVDPERVLVERHQDLVHASRVERDRKTITAMSMRGGPRRPSASAAPGTRPVGKSSGRKTPIRMIGGNHRAPLTAAAPHRPGANRAGPAATTGRRRPRSAGAAQAQPDQRAAASRSGCAAGCG